MAEKYVTLRVFRFDPKRDKKPYYKEYKVPYTRETTVLDALLWIVFNVDGSLSVRYNCRMALCGSCGMVVNGKFVLACQTRIEDLKSSTITVEPMPNYPIIKDLVVNMDNLLEKHKKVKPYLINRDEDLGLETYQSPEEREIIDEPTRCLLCGLCSAACPVAPMAIGGFLGPSVLINAYRFVVDSRDEAKNERLLLLDTEGSVWRCHQVQACNYVCPKDLKPADAILSLRRMILKKKFRFRR